MIKTYEQRKEEARQKAIDWQWDFCRKNHFFSELAEKTEYFAKLGKKYGLLKEFRENGII